MTTPTPWLNVDELPGYHANRQPDAGELLRRKIAATRRELERLQHELAQLEQGRRGEP